MRRYVFTVLCLSMVLFTSSFSGIAISNQSVTTHQNISKDLNPEGWWDTWIRDQNHNGIDDVLDDMIAKSEKTDRTRVFIDYYEHPTEDDVTRLLKFDCEVKYVYNIIDTICARNVLVSDIEKLAKLPKVVMVEYEDEIHATLDVGSRAVKARQSLEYSPDTVHDMGILGRNVSIAILDSGVDDGPSPAPPPYHDSLDDLDDVLETLDPKFIAGIDTTHSVYVTDGSWNPDDGVEGHGTHVAGIAMGTGAPIDNDGDGEYDYVGVAPQARLVDVKVMERWGTGVMGEAVRGIEWCVEHKDDDFDGDGKRDGIDIMSMSIGANYNSDGSDAASQAVNAAAEAGIVSVISVGNGGSNTVGPPGSADSAIAVGALDDQGTVDRSDDQRWASSNIGPRQDDNDEDHMDEMKPDVLAPGVDIMAPKSDTPGTYVQFSGTSMACPIVAGIVALMLEANPDLTPERVKEILQETAEMPSGIEPSTEYDDTYNYEYGWGFVDAYEAVRVAQQEDDRPPIISDIDINVSGITATISWRTHKAANSIIEYGESEFELDNVIEDEDNYIFMHSMTISKYNGLDLKENSDYYFKIIGYDEYGIGPGESDILSFHTDILPDTEPPQISDVEWFASDSTATIFWKTNELADSLVEYGLTIDYGNLEEDATPTIDHSITLSGLTAATNYYFRVNSTDGSGNNNHSINYILTTAAEPDTTPPVISNIQVLEITETTAQIVWTTDEPSDSVVRYGQTLSYGKMVSDSNHVYPTHSIKLTGLEPTTIYYYEIQSTDPRGNTAKVGDENTWFNTTGPQDTIAPSITKGPIITILTDTTATIEWETDEESEGFVEYGLSKGYGSKEPDEPSGEYVFEHNITLTGLLPSTTYHFRILSVDRADNVYEGVDDTFKTAPPADKTAPKIITGPTVIFKSESTATIVWVTDEKSNSELYYGTSPDYGFEVKEESLVIDHEITLTGLTPSTTYNYMVKSSDASGNYVESGDNFFKTLDISIPIKIEFLNLVDGQKVRGVIEINVEITPGAGIIKDVKYRVDNETWLSLGDGTSHVITIDTSKYSEGEHTLYITASDGRTTMQDEITFIVEHEKDESGELMLWLPYMVLALLIILVIALVVSRVNKRRGIITESSVAAPGIASEAPFSPDIYEPYETGELAFVPDEEPILIEETEAEISFIPDTTILSEEPEIAFIPDREAISFNVVEEEPVTTFAQFDTVRCPKCKSTFDADISSDIVCPECGFSATLKR